MVPVRVLVFSPSRCGMRLGLSRAVSSRVPGVRRSGLVSCSRGLSFSRPRRNSLSSGHTQNLSAMEHTYARGLVTGLAAPSQAVLVVVTVGLELVGAHGARTCARLFSVSLWNAPWAFTAPWSWSWSWSWRLVFWPVALGRARRVALLVWH